MGARRYQVMDVRFGFRIFLMIVENLLRMICATKRGRWSPRRMRRFRARSRIDVSIEQAAGRLSYVASLDHPPLQEVPVYIPDVGVKYYVSYSRQKTTYGTPRSTVTPAGRLRGCALLLCFLPSKYRPVLRVSCPWSQRANDPTKVTLIKKKEPID